MAALHTSFENLEKICAKNPTSILFARLAEGLFQKGDVVRATEICRQGLRYRPSYVAGHVVLGKCHLASGRIEEARQEFQKVLQLDADHPAALLNLGHIDLKLGWEDLALGHFERVLVLDPLDANLKAQVDQLRAKRHAEAPDPKADVLFAKDPEGEPIGESSEADDSGEAAVLVSGPSVLDAVPEPVDLADSLAVPFEAEENTEAPLRVADVVASESEDVFADDEDIDAPFDRATDEDEEDGDIEVEPIATLTLAELYLGQGLVAQAIGVLECIVARDPANQKIRDRLAELHSEGV